MDVVDTTSAEVKNLPKLKLKKVIIQDGDELLRGKAGAQPGIRYTDYQTCENSVNICCV